MTHFATARYRGRWRKHSPKIFKSIKSGAERLPSAAADSAQTPPAQNWWMVFITLQYTVLNVFFQGIGVVLKPDSIAKSKLLSDLRYLAQLCNYGTHLISDRKSFITFKSHLMRSDRSERDNISPARPTPNMWPACPHTYREVSTH